MLRTPAPLIGTLGIMSSDGGTMDLDKSLASVIADSGVLDVAADLAEGRLDTLLTDGPLKDIPFFGSLLAIWSAGRQIRDWLFVRKLGNFLKPIAELPSKDRDKFREKLNADKDARDRVGEHLILLLEKLDDARKPEIVSRAFIGYLNGAYDFETFQRLSFAIDRCFYPDLFQINPAGKQYAYTQSTAQNLTNAGLIEVSAIPSINAPETRNLYSTTDLGKTFRLIVLKKRA